MQLRQQVVEKQENQHPFDKRPITPFYFPYQSGFQVCQILVAQQPTADEEEARHVEHVYEPVEVAGAAAVTHYHERYAQRLGNVQGRVPALLCRLPNAHNIIMRTPPVAPTTDWHCGHAGHGWKEVGRVSKYV